MMCQAACATSLHGAGGEGEPESSRASSSCQVAKAGEVPSQSGPGRPPLKSSLAPLSSAFLGISEGPAQQSRQAAGRGAAAGVVPATATAWQQRAPGTVAINNLPTAAAVRPPAAGRCKYAAVPPRSAPAALAGAPNLRSPFSLSNAHQGILRRWENSNNQSQSTKRTRAQNLRVVSGRGPRKLPGKSGREALRPNRGLWRQRPRAPPRVHPGGSTVLPPLAEGGRAVASQLRRGEGPPIAQTPFESSLQP